jgi:transposase InsO family protein
MLQKDALMMTRLISLLRTLLQLAGTLLTLLVDTCRYLRLCLRSPAGLAAENLFLRKQLALYQERHVTPQRTTHATRVVLVWLSRWFDWRQALYVVQPETFLRWHREGFRLFWRWQSHRGRPRIPAELQALIRVVIEHASRRLLHVNVTAHPTAEWTLQQLREAIPSDHGYRFLIHDRDRIFSYALDQSIRHLGLKGLKTPVRTPVANAICERFIGTLRHECLDFVIPLTANHLRHLVMAWVQFYNEHRPHMSLGPGIPQPLASLPAPWQPDRHRLPASLCVTSWLILGGLHHDYRLEPQAA